MPDTVVREISEGAVRVTDRRRRTFVTLDGMRGVAAISVVIWHLPGQRLLASAYLAVDLFFMLSGFVLAYRYHDKLQDDREVRSFLVMRWIRLYPLYLIGSLIGLAELLWWTGGHARLSIYAVECLFAVLAVPLPSAHGLVFPLNVPAWSLFWEYLVNALFAFTNRRLAYGGIVAIIAAFGLLMIGMLVAVGHLQFTGQMPKFLFAGIRAMFGFYVGVGLFLLWREKRLPAWRVHPALLLILVPLLLAAPAARPLGPILTFAIVFVAFPLLVTIGLESAPEGALERMMSWLGLLSFPLYSVHYPLLLMLGHIMRSASMLSRLTVALALSLAVAWVSLKLWDVPVRRWLTHLHQRAATK